MQDEVKKAEARHGQAARPSGKKKSWEQTRQTWQVRVREEFQAQLQAQAPSVLAHEHWCIAVSLCLLWLLPSLPSVLHLGWSVAAMLIAFSARAWADPTAQNLRSLLTLLPVLPFRSVSSLQL